jgi:hypothetical protein
MRSLCALVLAMACLPAAADGYLGILKAPDSTLLPRGLYTFSSAPAPGFSQAITAESGSRFKLGYKYSRYLAVEGEFSEFTRPADVFANPASLASAFRSTGFGMDAVATLPLWRFSLYGRMGAYHGDRNGFNAYSTGLLGDRTLRGTHWRYGLGMRFDITRTLGIRAELERHANGLGSPLAGDIDSDQVTVGVSWRF